MKVRRSILCPPLRFIETGNGSCGSKAARDHRKPLAYSSAASWSRARSCLLHSTPPPLEKPGSRTETVRIVPIFSRSTNISGSVRLSFQATDHAVYGPPSSECHRNCCTLKLHPLEPHIDAKSLRLQQSRMPRIEFVRSLYQGRRFPEEESRRRCHLVRGARHSQSWRLYS